MSLEPQPHRVSRDRPQAVREPEHPQVTAADYRASPPRSAPEDPRSPGSQRRSKQVADYALGGKRPRPGAGAAQITRIWIADCGWWRLAARLLAGGERSACAGRWRSRCSSRGRGGLLPNRTGIGGTVLRSLYRPKELGLRPSPCGGPGVLPGLGGCRWFPGLLSPSAPTVPFAPR